MFGSSSGTDNRVEEWVYHHGGSAKPSGVWSWEDYKKAGPLLISLNRPGTLCSSPGTWKPLPEGKPQRIFFSNVSVKLVGSNTWMNAQ